jgi:hypothetical protein
LSLLQLRAQPQSPAGALAHPPLGSTRRLGCHGELPRETVPLGLRQHLAVPFTGELAGNMWVQVHVTHLLPWF